MVYKIWENKKRVVLKTTLFKLSAKPLGCARKVLVFPFCTVPVALNNAISILLHLSKSKESNHTEIVSSVETYPHSPNSWSIINTSGIFQLILLLTVVSKWGGKVTFIYFEF